MLRFAFGQLGIRIRNELTFDRAIAGLATRIRAAIAWYHVVIFRNNQLICHIGFIVQNPMEWGLDFAIGTHNDVCLASMNS
jgi:hypothetical protein